MTTTAQTAPTTRFRAGLVLVALSLTFGLVQLDATIVNVALDSVRADLGGGVDAAQWLIDGYAVPFAAFMLTAGALGDRLGHRRACLAGFAVFAAASMLAALSGGWALLIVARVLQGVGAALMLPSSLALVGRLYPEPRARARALGVWGGIATTGFAVGPVLGGVLLSHFRWPVIFWINLPIAAALAAVIAWLAPTERPEPRAVDAAGTVLATAALAVLTAGVIEAGQRHVAIGVVLVLVGVALASWFVRVERRHPSPLLPAALIRGSAFRWTLGVGFAFNLLMYGALLVVSLVLQSSFEFSPLAGGLAILPMALVVSVGATSSGFINAALGPRKPMLAGFGLATVGAVVLALGGLLHAAPLLVVGLAVIGLMSLAMPAMTSVALAAAPDAHTGVASGALNTARQMGGAAGVAVLGALVNAGGDRGGVVAASLVGALAGLVALVGTIKATEDPHDR